MNSAGPLTAYSVVVHLGRSLPQRVSDQRLHSHRWLAHGIVRTGVVPRSRPDSAYLSVEELALDPSRLRDYVRPPEDLPDNAIVIFDLADAPYEFLTERLLRTLAALTSDFLAARRTVLILLSQSPPPRSSALWQLLERLTAARPPSRVVVLDEDGNVRSFGAKRNVKFATLQRNWPQRWTGLQGNTLERFQRKIVARVGHFDLSGRSRRTCGRYYYDYSTGDAELAELLEEWLRRHHSSTLLRSSRIVLCRVRSSAIEVAAMRAAKRVGAGFALMKDPQQTDRLSAESNILVFDVVNSGATVEEFRSAIPDWGVEVHPRAFAAMATEGVSLRRQSLRVDAQVTVKQETVLQRECQRCRDRVPYTDPTKDDPFLAISADTMWWMLEQVDWAPEGYGPNGQAKYDFIPSLEGVFEQWGDWIAYKYSRLLEELGQTDLLVVICPEETAVLRLLDRLSALYDDQLVHVAIPRDLLDEVSDRPDRAIEVAAEVEGVIELESRREVDSDIMSEWTRQLRHLRAIEASVVVVDEFTASGTTARGLAELLRAFDVEVAAYLPFLDWDAERSDPSFVTRALYSIPNPRPIVAANTSQ